MDDNAVELSLEYLPKPAPGKLQFIDNGRTLQKLARRLARAKKGKKTFTEEVELELLRPVDAAGGYVGFELGLTHADFNEARQLAEESFGPHGLKVAEVKLSWIRGGTSGIKIKGYFTIS